MTDYFALLGQPRRPWLEVEALKSGYLELSTAVHPDHVHAASPGEKEAATRRYAELNTAHGVLREPKSRLLHLLELELGRRPGGIEQAPPDLMPLFMQVGQMCREADQLKLERARVTSPMLKVKSFEQGLALAERVKQLQGELRRRLTDLESELARMNAAWEGAPSPGSEDRLAVLPLPRLEDIARTWSFASRWFEQLQERLIQLAL